MGIFSGCMLVSDIDGTLCENGIIPPVNLQMIRYFKREGGIFTIATGRGPTVGIDICRRAEVNAPVLFCNGALVYDIEKKKAVHATALPQEGIEAMLKAIEKYPQMGAEVTYENCIVTYNNTPRTVTHRAHEGIPLITEPPEGAVPLKVLFMTDDKLLLEEFKNYMQTIKPDNCDYVVTSPIFYEIVAKGVSKATNLGVLAEACGADKNKIYCIGDCDNDVEMVSAAAVGAFCENAEEHLKKYANYVTVPVGDGAVADFINYIKTLQE